MTSLVTKHKPPYETAKKSRKALTEEHQQHLPGTASVLSFLPSLNGERCEVHPEGHDGCADGDGPADADALLQVATDGHEHALADGGQRGDPDHVAVRHRGVHVLAQVRRHVRVHVAEAEEEVGRFNGLQVGKENA